MTTPTDGPGEIEATEARNRLALATGVALLVAGLVLVTAVLPAEYGLDPLGTGARLGLMEISATAQQLKTFSAGLEKDRATAQAAVVPQDRAFKTETVEFKLAPKGWVEYKYRLDKGKALLYSWKATGPVSYELHAEPDGAPRGYAESYEKVAGRSEAAGTLTAPFPGIHGWYWENRGSQDVTIALTTAGFYTLAHEFRDGAEVKNKTFP